ncbi:MAG TPA: RNA polymerase sigma-70 factor [Solirubrobacterales bacterium]|nr:RNA polymerase sigma-70 factor [Solirubrobacterales bacterium]
MSGEREQVLAELRPVAFAVAYRMLGSVTEAEDVVQEALLRLDAVLSSGERISSPRAYIATVTTRLAIDELRSARARRETYVGEWLPEPLLGAGDEDPADRVELAESLSVGFLLLLERLTPEERAVLLLHDVFGYGYGEVGEVIGKTADNARQIASRARRHLGAETPRFEGSRQHRDELAGRFLAAAQTGEVEALKELLARDVVLRGDGGGKVPALARPLRGPDRVAQALVNWSRQGQRAGVEPRPTGINGNPGVLFVDPDGGLIGAMSVEVSDGGIAAVNSVVNPDKLRHLGPVGDMRALLGRAAEAARSQQGPSRRSSRR